MRVFWVATVCGVVLATPSAHASPSPAGLSISLSAEYRTGSFARGWSGFVSVELPFERWAGPRAMRAESHLAEGPPKKESDASPAPAAGSTPAPAVSPPPTPALSGKLARGTVRHALASAGYLNAR